MKKIFWILLNVGVSVLFLWLATRGIDWDQLGVSLWSVSWLMAGVSVAINLASCWLRAWRWQILMAPIKTLPLRRVFSALMIGFTVNNILPFRLGEFARCFVLKKKDGMSFTATMATVIVERAIDVVTLLGIFVLLIFLIPFPDWIKQGGFVVGAIDGIVILTLWVVYRKKEWASAFSRRILEKKFPGLSRKVERVIGSFAEGIRFTESARSVILVLAVSAVVWWSYIMAIYVMFRGFDIPEIRNLDFADASVFMTFTSFAIMIPAAPGYVGTFHEVAKQSLMMFDIKRDAALAFAIFFHAVNYIVQTGLGLMMMAHEQLKLKETVSDDEPLG